MKCQEQYILLGVWQIYIHLKAYHRHSGNPHGIVLYEFFGQVWIQSDTTRTRQL